MSEPDLDAGAEPEPGTNEWHYATGNYVDPEPEWGAGEPYVDSAHGVAYWDTPEGMAAGREQYPDYRHVGPEQEAEAG